MAKPDKNTSDNSGSTPRSKKKPARAVSDAVGDKLREIYDDVLTEPVPPELTELVRRLSERDDNQK